MEQAVTRLLDDVMKRMEVAVDSSRMPGRRGRPKGLNVTEDGSESSEDGFQCLC